MVNTGTRFCNHFRKNSKCVYSQLSRIYKRETIPADYNTGAKTKQKFVAFAWYCPNCKKIYEDLKK